MCFRYNCSFIILIESDALDGKNLRARVKANKKWDNKNKDRKQYLNQRSVAKNFILKKATKEDLKSIEQYITDRKNQLGL
ncbi:hypothetical protein [Lactobacillus hominis]|uniref:Uncharacterized protein n=1 Tax=Lactobacillus hominis DSM 23910 = CRBIP 24.179 TaxID=1423758 RepID=I7L4T1_9LACO|nr:hypothetical protein [Lactobacillus hominis]KRM86095.1 hypothetical protein FC41_GL000288 [Lactobacillus hominis DSM 23910 = CRBIP 24.179]CCI80947.1 Putative uncharacterized protein [Lactobacillus hominis DSM 23910 = CRBIP 24.179]